MAFMEASRTRGKLAAARVLGVLSLADTDDGALVFD